MSDLVKAMTLGHVPWKDPYGTFKKFWIFKDKYPVTEGHLLFIPTYENFECLMECYKAAYKFGHDMMQRGQCDGFNVGQNIGESAGQTVMYPHVHLIPRRKGDMEDPRGGVRHVIPEKGNYKK